MSSPAHHAAVRSSGHRLWPWILLIFILLFAAGVRFRLLDMPLERDEGEYAYSGQLMLQGIPPFELAYNVKLPGTSAAYAAIMAVFGQTDRAIHAGLLLINAASVLLLFLLARRLFDSIAGVVAAAAYAVMSVSPLFLGFAAHATHFVVLLMLAGMLSLLHALQTKRHLLFFASGICFGLAFLMKQHGAAFGLFAGLWILLDGTLDKSRNGRELVRNFGFFSVECLLPCGICCLILWWSNVFASFWQWVFDYARIYTGIISFPEGMRLLRDQLLRQAIPFWPVALLSVFSLALVLWQAGRKKAVFVILFLLVSMASVCPGWAFREHYFILVLPALALLLGAGASLAAALFALNRPALRRLAIALPVAAILFSVVQQRHVFFLRSVPDVTKYVYGHNPFVEAREIGLHLRDHSKPDARIFVFGSEPEIYFYARRHSASGFIYMYDVVQDQPKAREMQQQLINEVTSVSPEFLVVVGIPTSWFLGQGKAYEFLNWGEQFCAQYYELVGLADLVSAKSSTILWDAEARAYNFQSTFQLQVYARKPVK